MGSIRVRDIYSYYHLSQSFRSLHLLVRRDHEWEADDVGIQLVALARYDTERAARIFSKFAAIQGNTMSLTHPSSKVRFAHLHAASSTVNWRSHKHCNSLLRSLAHIGITFN